MGKVKGVVQNWLDEYGHDLGYDMSNIPDLSDFWWIVDNKVDAQDYWENKWKGDK